MRNWLGQDIQVGTTVYRGAREGNSSSYKVGEVTKINEKTHKATVKWLVEPGSVWLYDDQGKHVTSSFPRLLRSSGTSDVNTLVPIDPTVAETAVTTATIAREVYDYLPRSKGPNVANPNFTGYPLERHFNESVRHELAQRGITV